MESIKESPEMVKTSTTTPADQPSSDSPNESYLVEDPHVFFTGNRGYFFFIPEIRYQIMGLVLMPGDIYLKSKPIVGTVPSKFHRKRYGVQLLATCRQAYEEGHQMYYSSNTFHLPAGRNYWSMQLFQSIQPKHYDMIQYMAIECSIFDIHYPKSIQDIGFAADTVGRTFRGTNLPNLPLSINPPYLAEKAGSYCTAAGVSLLLLWRDKFQYVWQDFPRLKKISVTFVDDDSPWLDQYFGLVPQSGNGQESQEQSTELSGQQVVDQGASQDDKDHHSDYRNSENTLDVSRDDLSDAVAELRNLQTHHFPPNDLPLVKAALTAEMLAELAISREFECLMGDASDGQGVTGHRSQDNMLIMKSTWAFVRIGGRCPRPQVGNRTSWLRM